MTTIAVRDGVLACDSRATSDDGLSPEIARKAWISRRHGGVIFAGCGMTANVHAAAKAIEARRQLPWDAPARWNPSYLPSLAESRLLVLCRDGRMFIFEDEGWSPIEAPFFAIGSGAVAALAAMKMGASASRAVEVAIELDHNSGGQVHVLRTADIPMPKARRR